MSDLKEKLRSANAEIDEVAARRREETKNLRKKLRRAEDRNKALRHQGSDSNTGSSGSESSEEEHPDKDGKGRKRSSSGISDNVSVAMKEAIKKLTLTTPGAKSIGATTKFLMQVQRVHRMKPDGDLHAMRALHDNSPHDRATEALRQCESEIAETQDKDERFNIACRAILDAIWHEDQGRNRAWTRPTNSSSDSTRGKIARPLRSFTSASP